MKFLLFNLCQTPIYSKAFNAPQHAPFRWYSFKCPCSLTPPIAHHRNHAGRERYLVEKLMGVVRRGRLCAAGYATPAVFNMRPWWPTSKSRRHPSSHWSKCNSNFHQQGGRDKADAQNAASNSLSQPHYGAEYWLTPHKLRLPIRLTLSLPRSVGDILPERATRVFTS
jgi:hypothetical protein